MQCFNKILFSAIIVCFVYVVKLTVSQTSSSEDDYYCYTCRGQKSNRKCLNTYTKCAVNESCYSSYAVKSTGHIYGITKKCSKKCSNPTVAVNNGGRGRRYCCFGHFCNQQTQFYKPDGLKPGVGLPIDITELGATTKSATTKLDSTTESATTESATTELVATTQSATTELVATAQSATTELDATTESATTELDAATESATTELDATTERATTELDATTESATTEADAATESATTEADDIVLSPEELENIIEEAIKNALRALGLL